LDHPHGRRPNDKDNGLFEMMQNITITSLITLGLAIPAMADAIVPEEYQGVWAAAQDCKQNFQNILPRVVNREHDTFA
jgi:hypothetical protein